MVIIGTIKEVKNNENRVGLTPLGIKQLKKDGHKVIVQKGCGVNSGFTDNEYKKAGATIVKSPKQVAKQVDILVKVKEPIRKEYRLLRLLKNKILFTYLHLAAVDKRLTMELIKNNITAIAYETVVGKDGRSLPLLQPMSQVAGVLAIQYGAQYLQKKYKGRGVTLGHIDNATPAKVVVIGGGNVGLTATKTAIGMGCEVHLYDKNKEKIEQLKKEFKKTYRNGFDYKIEHSTKLKVKDADLVVGAVLVPGAKAPKVVTERMVKSIKKGAVLMDVAIDQGGCIWGSKPTTHSKPIYYLHEKVYCCITNMPGQVALQSTEALTNATLPFLKKIAKNRLSTVKSGINVSKGKIRLKVVADALHLKKYYEEL